MQEDGGQDHQDVRQEDGGQGHQDVPHDDADGGRGKADVVEEPKKEWPPIDYDEEERNQLLLHMLRRLPVKSLLRFRCVCPLWKGMISDPRFHLDHAATPHPVSGVFYHSAEGNPAYAPFCRATASLPDPSLSFLPESASVMSSARGLLCCRGRRSQLYFVCNPATDLWVRLPPQRKHHGFDTAAVLMIHRPPPPHPNVVFRVVCAYPDISKDLRRRVYAFETFSSDAWEWTESNCSADGVRLLPGSGVAVGNRAFWQTTNGRSMTGRIVVYDPVGDQKLELRKPGTRLDLVMSWELGEMDGQICVTYVKTVSPSEVSVEVHTHVKTATPPSSTPGGGGGGGEWRLSGKFELGGRNIVRTLGVHGAREVLLWDSRGGRISSHDLAGRAIRVVAIEAAEHSAEFVPFISTLLGVKGGSRRGGNKASDRRQLLF